MPVDTIPSSRQIYATTPILIVKVSSLGDVVQAQPIVQDLRRAFPGVVVDWATDTDFAAIPAWNHGVNRVHSAPLRQFKKTRAPRDLRRIVQSLRKLRLDRYDAVLDIHGVYKSAIIAFLARSPKRFGYARQALGETGAAFAYTDRFEKLHEQTVIDGLRHSVGKARNYRLDSPGVLKPEVQHFRQPVNSVNGKENVPTTAT